MDIVEGSIKYYPSKQRTDVEQVFCECLEWVLDSHDKGVKITRETARAILARITPMIRRDYGRSQ